MDTLVLLKQQLEAVEAQIKPLETMRAGLRKQIDRMTTDATLAEYGLARDDALAITDEFMDYNSFTQYEREHRTQDVVYVAGIHFDKPYVTTNVGGIGLALAATFDMAQRMKAAHAPTADGKA